MEQTADKDWLYCPVCHNKTRTMVREDTVLQNFPLFCPKCRQEVIVNVSKSIIRINGNSSAEGSTVTINEPDAMTQSRQP